MLNMQRGMAQVFLPAVAGLCIAIFAIAEARAVQLGPMFIRSSFGEPLDAVIPIADTKGVSLRRLRLAFFEGRAPDQKISR